MALAVSVASLSRQQVAQGSVSVANGGTKEGLFWSRDQYVPGARLLHGSSPTGESTCLRELGGRAQVHRPLGQVDTEQKERKC